MQLIFCIQTALCDMKHVAWNYKLMEKDDVFIFSIYSLYNLVENPFKCKTLCPGQIQEMAHTKHFEEWPTVKLRRSVHSQGLLNIQPKQDQMSLSGYQKS